MRSLLLSVFFICLSFSAYSQDTFYTCVKIAPIGLVWKVHVDVEQVVSNQISIGANLQHYYNQKNAFELPFMNGYKVDGYCRIYFQKHAPTGWYFQPSLGFGNYLDDGLIHRNFKGGALAIGGQHRISNSQVLLDFSLAIQIYPPFAINDLSQIFWFIGGQGTLMAPRFSVGYAF